MSAYISTAITGILLAATFSAPAILAHPAEPPRPGETVLVVTPPWSAAADVSAQAGGVVVARGVVPFIAAAYSPDAGFAASLESGGALFVFSSALGEAWLCR